MSTDQFNPEEVVRIRYLLENKEHKWSDPVPRKIAEAELSSGSWLSFPNWEGEPVVSAAIVKYTFN